MSRKRKPKSDPEFAAAIAEVVDRIAEEYWAGENEATAVDRAFSRVTARKCGFPARFADAFLRRGYSGIELADVLRHGASLRLQ